MEKGDTFQFYLDGLEHTAKIIEDVKYNKNKKFELIVEIQESNKPDEDFKD